MDFTNVLWYWEKLGDYLGDGLLRFTTLQSIEKYWALASLLTLPCFYLVVARMGNSSPFLCFSKEHQHLCSKKPGKKTSWSLEKLPKFGWYTGIPVYPQIPLHSLMDPIISQYITSNHPFISHYIISNKMVGLRIAYLLMVNHLLVWDTPERNLASVLDCTLVFHIISLL